MPKPAFERRKDAIVDQSSVESNSTMGSGIIDISAERIKDFYRTIPDYNEIHHLPPEEFYSTLNRLREKKNMMLGISLDVKYNFCDPIILSSRKPSVSISDKKVKSNLYENMTQKHRKAERYLEDTKKPDTLKQILKTDTVHDENIPKSSPSKGVLTNAETNKTNKAKRIGSACSISWNDLKNKEKDDIDEKFDKYFDGKNYRSKDYDDEFKTRSMPSSPVRVKHFGSPLRRRKSITIPKPFKMTDRDDDLRTINELRNLRKCFSDEMLNQKNERRLFRARPVPIESRIPLYDKILEDQAMRRAITKINSEAELRAQMKPFSFTKRADKSLYPGMCKRATNVVPSTKKKKRFKARPVPKDLFSNYLYDKNKADEFFRSVNRRIRAEEMLKTSSLPSNMAARERSRLSTPAAHSDLPIDPSPVVPSISSSGRRTKSPTKEHKKNGSKKDFITTSPQPFRFNTATRAAKKMEDLTRKIYTESQSTTSMSNSVPNMGARAFSALELRNHASGRSNLAALLRTEVVRQRFESEAARRFADQRRKMEIRYRDRLLRTNPAWSLVRNNHEEEIALRLRTRRDEERMRHEEFMHEMELMYGRVNQQPMLFERFYAPKYYQLPVDSLQLSPRKGSKKTSKKYSDISRYESPCPSQKHDAADTDRKGGMDYLKGNDNDDKLFSDSEQAAESLYDCNKNS